MRRNGLIIGLVLVLGVVLVARAVVQFGFPSLLKAQSSSPASTGGESAIGTHAAFFDVGGNTKISNLVKSKGGSTITVMVDINASIAQINSILDAANGLTKIIRIVGVNHEASLQPAKAQIIANQLNASNIQPGTIVVFGNEVNNLDAEWKSCSSACQDISNTISAAHEYGQFYSKFRDTANKSKYTPVPSPLDMYNGVYTDYGTFISESGVYGDKDVANVYDVGDLKLNSPSKYPGQVIAYTEYGPDPAKSLQDHLNFYKANPPPAGIIATTLVPNKCDPGAKDSWLYYIAGKIYDSEGNEIDPATCDKSSGHSGLPPAGDYYKRFVYPFYSAKSSAAELTQKLENDYSMSCSNPADYQTGNSGSGTIEELIKYQAGRCETVGGYPACLFQPDATFSVASSGLNRMFGVLRNENEVKWRAYDYSKSTDPTKREFTNRFESVEQWFGANNPSLHTPGGPGEYLNQTPDEINGLHQGPFYKLTPLLGQCLAEGEVLKASTELCEEWGSLDENKGQKCQLTERKVVGTTKTYGSLYSSVQNAGGTDNLCHAVFNYGTKDHPNPPSADQIAITNDMSRVDLYQETAYRPAFLVMATETDNDKPPIGPNNPTQQIRVKGAPTTGKHKVDFLVYHVPDTITDMKKGESGETDDIITRTAKTFITAESTTKAEDEWQKDRGLLADSITATKGSPLPPIDCHGGECDQPLERALIDFINGYVAANQNGELTPDAHGITECKAVNPDAAESGTRIGSQLAPNDDPLKKTDAKANVQIQEYLGTGGPISKKTEPLQTRIYNITPHGFRTQYVAAAFDALFAQAQQEGQFDDKDYKTTFESIFGSTLDTNPSIAGYDKPILGADGQISVVDGVSQYEHKEVVDDIHLTQDPPQISARIPWLAKVMNYSTRAIVQQISASGQNLLECARAVTDPTKNTEDFLLHCQTRGSSVATISPTKPGDLGAPASGFNAFNIQYWSGDFVAFTIPPQEVVNAANAAAEKHGCDPYLVIATAHSESQQYTNFETPNLATARGVWQFTSPAWGTWWSAGSHEPGSFVAKDPGGKFDCSIPRAEGPNQCSPTNVYAAADAACRLLNWTGANNHYDDHRAFTIAFGDKGDNPLGQFWNNCAKQGEYVWRLWHALKEVGNEGKYHDQNVGLANLNSCGQNGQ